MPVRPGRLKGLAGDGRVQVTQITVIADTELRVDVLPPYPFVASVVTLGFVISGGQLLQSFGPFVVSFFVISHDDSFLNSRYMGFRPKSYGAGFSFFRPPGSLVRGRGVFCRGGCGLRSGAGGRPGRGSGGGGKGLRVCTGPVPFDADEHITFGNGVFSVTGDQLVAQAGRKETGDLFIVSGTDIERIGVEFHVNGGYFHGCRYSVRIYSFIAWRCRQVVGADWQKENVLINSTVRYQFPRQRAGRSLPQRRPGAAGHSGRAVSTPFPAGCSLCKHKN